MVSPGGSEERGNVVVSCPSGGMACVVTVAADGTAVYDRTGGTPTVMSAQEPWTLPSGHGLAAGEITVQPGRSEENDNIVVTCPAGGMACVVTVATDGAATYERTGGVPTFMLVPPEEFPELPLQQPVRRAQAPIVDLEGVLHVGANVAPPADQLAAGGAYNGVTVSSGRVLDGVGADRVIEYLEQYVNLGEYKNTVGLETFSTRPVVRLADGTSDEFAEYATRAVQLINAALPYEKRIVFSRDSAPPLAAIADVPDGDILSTLPRTKTGTFRTSLRPVRRPGLIKLNLFLITIPKQSDGKFRKDARLMSGSTAKKSLQPLCSTPIQGYGKRKCWKVVWMIPTQSLSFTLTM